MGPTGMQRVIVRLNLAQLWHLYKQNQEEVSVIAEELLNIQITADAVDAIMVELAEKQEELDEMFLKWLISICQDPVRSELWHLYKQNQEEVSVIAEELLNIQITADAVDAIMVELAEKQEELDEMFLKWLFYIDQGYSNAVWSMNKEDSQLRGFRAMMQRGNITLGTNIKLRDLKREVEREKAKIADSMFIRWNQYIKGDSTKTKQSMKTEDPIRDDLPKIKEDPIRDDLPKIKEQLQMYHLYRRAQKKLDAIIMELADEQEKPDIKTSSCNKCTTQDFADTKENVGIVPRLEYLHTQLQQYQKEATTLLKEASRYMRRDVRKAYDLYLDAQEKTNKINDIYEVVDQALIPYLETSETFHSVVENMERPQVPMEKVMVLSGIGMAELLLGKLNEAQGKFEEALSLLNEEAIPVKASLQENLGSVYLMRDQFKEAKHYYRLAFNEYTVFKARKEAVRALVFVAICAFAQDDRVGFERSIDEGIAFAQEHSLHDLKRKMENMKVSHLIDWDITGEVAEIVRKKLDL